MMIAPSSLCALLLSSLTCAVAWREWPNDGQSTAKWTRNWVREEEQNRTYLEGPGERYGHSMVLHDTRIILFGGRANEIRKEHIPKSYTVEDQDGTIEFASYSERVYDCKYLLRKRQFIDPNATLDTENCTAELAERSIIPASFLWNDVWMYDLNCTRKWQQGCSGDYESQWTVVHEGAIDGGCRNHIELGQTRLICTVPSERYFHGAARFDDSTMLIYGGFSHRCEDYCDDLWSLDLRNVGSRNYSKTWTEIHPIGYFDHGGTGSMLGGVSPGKRWKFSVVTDGRSMMLFGGMTLWEGFLPSSSSSSSASKNYPSEATANAPPTTKFVGGSKKPGGFLDDMWVFRKRLLTRGWGGINNFLEDVQGDFTDPRNDGGGPDPENYASQWEENPVDSGDFGFWEKVNVTEECLPDPAQASWTDRFDQYCREFWPSPRAGHVAVLDSKRGGLWLHGGYRTHYPYLNTAEVAPAMTNDQGAETLAQAMQESKSRGSSSSNSNNATGNALASASRASNKGRVPFGAFDYFLDDLWLFNFTRDRDDYGGRIHHEGGRWTQIRPMGDGHGNFRSPMARMEHTMVLSDNILILAAGFSANNHLDDTWLFNITTGRWLEKVLFEEAIYPTNCTDDCYGAECLAANCFELQWPRDRERDAYYPFEPLDDRQQRWYAPDFHQLNKTNSYYGILDKGEHVKFNALPLPEGNASSRHQSEQAHGAVAGRFGVKAPDGTPIVPFAETGPRQYVRNVSFEEAARMGIPVAADGSVNVSVYERCSSVYGEPTRGTHLDGAFGRADESIMVAQPRRQRHGWDGCRDRADNRSDLPARLYWSHPPQRSGHAAVYHEAYGILLVYGGRGPLFEQPHSSRKTHEFSARDDFWQFSVNNCQNNCSNHGFCSYGYCTCEDGYYGFDCSNTSCPGDYCYYDEYTNEQVCQHCCSAGYNHTDDDVYVDRTDSRKVPCSNEEPGLSHGICDGFGTCQCAPPFLGLDCSIKDCKDNCNYNGYCSVEYPVSRCVCNPTYFGESCEFIECINNCSYPNGLCNYTEGECYCNYLYNPYDNTRRWATSWENQEVKWEGQDCSYLTAYSAAVRRGSSEASGILAVLLSIAATAASIVLLLSSSMSSSGSSQEN